MKPDTRTVHTYSYSTAHRVLEIAAIAALPALLWALANRATAGLEELTGAWFAVALVGTLFAGYLAADFVSGVVHFLGDTYGDEETPWFGPSFIKPFRVHHTDPQEICRHDFVELNGNNCIVCFPVGLIAWWLLPADTLWGALCLLTLASMFVWVFMTNQFHKWAHEDAPPRVVHRLQTWGLVLSREHHDVHHRPPHDRYYCITVGWLNPLLTRVGFFEGIRRCVGWLVPSASNGLAAPADSPEKSSRR